MSSESTTKIPGIEFRFSPEETSKQDRWLALCRELLAHKDKNRIDWISSVISLCQLYRAELNSSNKSNAKKEVSAIDAFLGRNNGQYLIERIRGEQAVSASDIASGQKVLKKIAGWLEKQVEENKKS